MTIIGVFLGLIFMIFTLYYGYALGDIKCRTDKTTYCLNFLITVSTITLFSQFITFNKVFEPIVNLIRNASLLIAIIIVIILLTTVNFSCYPDLGVTEGVNKAAEAVKLDNRLKIGLGVLLVLLLLYILYNIYATISPIAGKIFSILLYLMGLGLIIYTIIMFFYEHDTISIVKNVAILLTSVVTMIYAWQLATKQAGYRYSKLKMS